MNNNFSLFDIFVLTSPITFICALLAPPHIAIFLGFNGAIGYIIGMGGFIIAGFIITTIDVIKSESKQL